MPAPRVNLTSWWAVSIFKAALTVAPVITAVLVRGRGLGAARTTVTPSFSATLNFKSALLRAARAITPSISASLKFHPGLLGSAALNLSPVIAATIGKIRPLAAALSVTPTISATITVAHSGTNPVPHVYSVAVTQAATR